ncbi:MAG: efflux RND transporter periplasmic adaptor subunit [Polyangiaceae bacterium]
MAEQSKKKRAVVVVVLIALVGGGAFYWRSSKTHAAEPATFHGNVDIRDVTLAFRVNGRVDAVLKQEGDHVKKGEVIARLDPAPYKLAVAQAKKAVEVAKANLKLMEAGARSEDIAQARALLKERKAARIRAEDQLKRLEPLVDAGAATNQDLVAAKSGAEQARAAVSAAQAVVTKTVRGPRVVELAVAQAQVEQAESAVDGAELNLKDTELLAASDGVIVTRAIEPGAIVGPGSPVLVVAVTDPVWIRAYANEAQLAMISPGTPVSVYTDARPGEPYTGQVGYVASQAEFTPKNVETEELRTSLVYRFRVIVEKHDNGLRQGMPVTIRLGSSAKPNPAPRGEAKNEQP